MRASPFDGLYRLVGQTPVPEYDVVTWARSFETESRRVAFTNVFDLAEVSTVFLGSDHNFFGGPPLLFETMIFWRGDAEEQQRCSTWLQAEEMHARMVRHASSPRAVLGYCARALREALGAAWDGLKELKEES